MKLTPEQCRAIEERVLLQERIPKGLGDEDNACTVAAINLALTGALTDDRPKCMSEVVHALVIPLQDAMPGDLRNSMRYRMLVPALAGTGNEPVREKQRLGTILDWMWGTVLPSVQNVADANGFTKEWQTMCSERTEAAARAAARAAEAAEAAAEVAAGAAWAAAWAAGAAWAARAAAWAARAAGAAAWAADKERIWTILDPISLLEKLVDGPCST